VCLPNASHKRRLLFLRPCCLPRLSDEEEAEHSRCFVVVSWAAELCGQCFCNDYSLLELLCAGQSVPTELI
jgi:hypothetical protein